MKCEPAENYTRGGASVSRGVDRRLSKKERRSSTWPVFINYMRRFLWNTMTSITIMAKPMPASIMAVEDRFCSLNQIRTPPLSTDHHYNKWSDKGFD